VSIFFISLYTRHEIFCDWWSEVVIRKIMISLMLAGARTNLRDPQCAADQCAAQLSQQEGQVGPLFTALLGDFLNSDRTDQLLKTAQLNSGLVIISDNCPRIEFLKEGYIDCIDVETYLSQTLPEETPDAVATFRSNVHQIYTRIRDSQAQNKHLLYPFLKDLLQLDILYHCGGIFIDADNTATNLSNAVHRSSHIGLQMAHCHNPSIIAVQADQNPTIKRAMDKFNALLQKIQKNPEGQNLLNRFFNEAYAAKRIGRDLAGWLIPLTVNDLGERDFDPTTDKLFDFLHDLLEDNYACLYTTSTQESTSSEPENLSDEEIEKIKQVLRKLLNDT
jgi:hypothetical protein